MPANFQNSLVFLAAQAKERDTQRQLAQLDHIEAQNNAAGASAYQQRAADIDKQNAEMRGQAAGAAEAEGAAAGYTGQDTPQFGSELQNQAAAGGAAKGKMTMAQLLASRESHAQEQAATLSGQKEMANLNNTNETGRIQASADAQAANEQEKFGRENPILHGQDLEKIDREGQYKIKSAAAGNPAMLTKAETSKVEQSILDANDTLAQLSTTQEAFGKLHPEDFGYWGAIKDMARNKAEQIAPGAMSRYTPDQVTKMDDMADFRMTFTSLANQYIHDMTGAAGSNNEYRRLGRALGAMNIDSDVSWNNYRTIGRAMQIVKQMAQIRRAFSSQALQNGAVPQDLPTTGNLPSRTDGPAAAPGPVERWVTGRNQAPPGGVSQDGRDISFADPTQATQDAAPEPAPPPGPGEPVWTKSQPSTAPAGHAQQTAARVAEMSKPKPAPKQPKAATKQDAKNRKADLEAIFTNAQGDEDSAVKDALKAGYSDDEVAEMLQ
jgi:hypothetical protein